MRARHRIADSGRLTWGVASCRLGWVIVAATGRGIRAIMFGDDPETLAELLHQRFPGADLRRGGEELAACLDAVVTHVENPASPFGLPLDIQGTPFQERVWAALARIEPGTTVSYGELAAKIGRPKAARAVGSACGANPIAVAIPCHRVVARDGSLGGYRWGADRKALLLDLEK